MGKSWEEVDGTWDRATDLLQGRPEPSSEMTLSTKMAFVKLERGEETGLATVPGQLFHFWAFLQPFQLLGWVGGWQRVS